MLDHDSRKKQVNVPEEHSGKSDGSMVKFSHNSPDAIAQRKIQQHIHKSPQVEKQNQLQSTINNSTLMIAQRKRKATIFNGAIQKKEDQDENLLQKKSNDTGMPDHLKAGVENLSGISMNQVKVHYNSSQPAQLKADAFAQGNDIHLGPGQEKHLPHEAWHVAQQKQGRVNGTTQLKGVAINDSPELEKEADKMGDEAAKSTSRVGAYSGNGSGNNTNTVQMHRAGVVQRFEMDEHRNTGNKYFTDLYAFLQTPEGKKWAKEKGYDAAKLLERMKNDPVIKGKKLHGSDKSKPKDGKPTEYEFGDPTGLMGDLFGSWSKLHDAPPEQISGLLNAESTGDYQKHSKGEYLKLAKKNDNHFAGKNKTTWRGMHEEAIKAAISAHAGKKEKMYNDALFIEASGAHFLTDAYAAGHLFRKDVILASILTNMNNNPVMTKNPQMQFFAGFVELKDKVGMAQMILKLVHDTMNKNGFEVENGKGMKWKTFGDGHAKDSPETQRMLALAVFESRQQIIKAYETGKEPDIKEAEDFFPTEETILRAEQEAMALIPQARSKVEDLMYAERASSPDLLGPGLGHAVWGMLNVVGDPGREMRFQQNEALNFATGRNNWKFTEDILTHDKGDASSGIPSSYMFSLPPLRF